MLRFHGRRAFLTLCVLAVVSTTSRAEDWPRWRGPRGDGTWHGPALPEQWPGEALPLRWTQPIGGGYAGVVVSQQRVFTMDRQPGDIERIVAWDAASGDLLWQHAYTATYGDLDYGNGPRAAPTVVDGRVYTLGAVGHAHCLDAATGEVVWSKDFVGNQGAELPEWGLAASPVIYGNLVIFHPGVQPGGSLVALDRATGDEVWRSSDDPAGYATPIVARTENFEQLIAWTPRHVLGLAPGDGRIQWSVPYEVTYGVSIATPIFQRGIVFVSGYWEGSKAIRLGSQPENAELAWEENRELRGLMSQPLYREGHVYLLDKHHGLVCFELETGRKVWNDGNRMTPRGRNPQATMVWLGDEDRAIILNADGELILARLNPTGYHEQSRAKLIGETWAHPAYAGRHVYARSDERLVCAELVGKADANRRINSSP